MIVGSVSSFLGWKVGFDLKTGLQRTIEWYEALLGPVKKAA